MDLSQWLASFRALHALAHQRKLTGIDAVAYRAGRDELARALVALQQLGLQPGQTPRRALRVARALQADLEGPLGSERLTTLDISLGGFAATMAKAPPAGETLAARLRLPGEAPLEAQVRVANVRAQTGSVRVGFAFTALSEAEEERLTLAIFDAVLGQLDI